MSFEKDLKEDSVISRAGKGAWVQIHRILLPPEERSDRVPQDTREVPLEMWENGFLIDEEAQLGEEVHIETAIGRQEYGVLSKINPGYEHSFGSTVPELLSIGKQLRTILREEEA